MGLIDRLKELDTAVLVALIAGVAVVGLVVLVVLAVILAAVVGSFVLGVGEETGTSVNAGASVQPDADASEVVVTFTGNQNADYLLVEWTATGGDVEPSGGEGEVTVEDGRARLEALGSSITLAATDPGSDTEVDVTVTAVSAESRTVIVERTVTV